MRYGLGVMVAAADREDHQDEKALVHVLEDRIPRALILAHSGLLAGFERVVGLHMGRWRILQVVSAQKLCPQSELRRLTIIDAATITRILKDFEREGLVARVTDPKDARQSLISLTPKGRQLVQRLQRKRNGYLSQALVGLSAKELTELERLLRVMAENLGKL
jgi:DNA-binding MarR family transcriptional regulator